jgi:hypothetical protein
MSHKSENKDSLDERLTAWRVDMPKDIGMKHRVLAEIEARQNHPSILGSIYLWVLHDRVATAALACSMILAVCTISLLVHSNSLTRQLDTERRDYFLMIDPISRVDAVNLDGKRTARNDSVVDSLAWMKDRFNLSREQFKQLVQLHTEYADHLTTLYKELSAIQSRYDTFDQRRLTNAEIDYMELYDLLQQRDAARKDSVQTSRQLVELVLRVLTPEQKLEYMSMLRDSISHPDPRPETPKHDTGV